MHNIRWTATSLTNYLMRPRAYHLSCSPRSIHSVSYLSTSHHRHDHNLKLRIRLSASSHFHSSSILLSDSFHGLTLDYKVSESKHGNVHIKGNSSIQEAQIVKTEKDKQKTRELIAELVRAEMLSHTSPKINEGRCGGSSDDEASKALSPYERQMIYLEQAILQHAKIPENDVLKFSKSSKILGDMHYKIGHMEQAQVKLMDGLQALIENSCNDVHKNEVQLIKSQIMHLLGAVMARCGEYDESLSWYDEALKLKCDLLNESKSNTITSRHHYEIGKTLNGLAALEVMSNGANANWEKATGLFQDAEKNYLYHYKQFTGRKSNNGFYEIPREMVQLMSPYLVQLVINVRSNMGELYRQQMKYVDAVEMFQMALDLAQMDVSRMSIQSQNCETNLDVSHDLESLFNEPSLEERRNAVIDLLVRVADGHVVNQSYDEAAASYEQALLFHVKFRSLTGNETDSSSENLLNNLNTRLPAATLKTVNIPLDLVNATTVEAAIRNNLAHALTRIGQEKLALNQYEHALKIKRHIGGENHVEVGHSLMEMGALLGGPMKDVMTALNCFKEALHIFQCQRDGLIEANFNSEMNLKQTFYDTDLELDEINEHISNASKNIAIIQDGLLKQKDGVDKQRRP